MKDFSGSLKDGQAINLLIHSFRLILFFVTVFPLQDVKGIFYHHSTFLLVLMGLLLGLRFYIHSFLDIT